MRKAALLLPIVFMAFAPVASATTINFDDVASGTLINNQYASLGVTFGCFNGNVAADNLCSGNVYAVTSPSSASPSNVLSLTSGTPLGDLVDERFGFFSATFASAQSSVSIDARNVNPPEFLGSTTNHPFLQAFDSGGNFITEADWTGNTDIEAYQTLTVSSSLGNIAFVAFSSFAASGHAVYGEFDNLTFAGTTGGGGNDGGGGTTVPEPGTLVMFGAGLCSLAFGRRSKISGRA